MTESRWQPLYSSNITWHICIGDPNWRPIPVLYGRSSAEMHELTVFNIILLLNAGARWFKVISLPRSTLRVFTKITFLATRPESRDPNSNILIVTKTTFR